MAWHLGDRTSAALIRWYLGPDHMSKLRMFRYLLGAMNNPRLMVPYGAGGRITLDYRDWLQDSILRTGSYEPEVWSTLSAHALCNEVFWDVGANIGSVSILACQDSRFRMIHAFEPHPQTYEILQSHLQLNQQVMGAQRIAHQLALGARCEERALTFGPAINSGMATLREQPHTGRARTNVRCTTADVMVYEHGIEPATLMKIDVEDWEVEVLRGAQRLLREHPPKAIAFETAANERGELVNADVRDLLLDNGYAINHVARPSGEVEARENYLALRRAIDG